VLEILLFAGLALGVYCYGVILSLKPLMVGSKIIMQTVFYEV
jgi:hypothetical protein